MSSKEENLHQGVIHRCYMTGQKCVYLRDLLSKHNSGAFVLSPFSEDFNFNWRFRLSRLRLKDKGFHGEIRRADSIARTGYVMCSRICYPLQAAELVIADVTVPNLNVFYELGITCALGKKCRLLAHSQACPQEVIQFLNGVGLHEHLFRYLEARDLGDSMLDQCREVSGFQITNTAKATDPNVRIFSNEGRSHLEKGQRTALSRQTKIHFIVSDVLQSFRANTSTIVDRCISILNEQGDTDRRETKEVTVEEIEKYLESLQKGVRPIEDSGGRETLAALKAADFILVDASLNDFETYFWLGLCHGLELDVVPMSISDDYVKQPVLPFDTRTLWHVGGTFAEHQNLTDQLAQIVLEIVARHVANRSTKNRDHFWHRMVNTHKLSFYVGTEQSSQLASKQVIGEWDLRAFQEISSFASRSNPNLDIKIEKPVFRVKEFSDESKRKFEQLLRRRMGGTHCIIIGTPDVNPVAEMTLSALKGLEPFVKWHSESGPRPRGSGPLRVVPSPQYNNQQARRVLEGYVAFKNHKFDYSQPQPATFFLQFDDETPERGFYYYDDDGRYKGDHCEGYVPRRVFTDNSPGTSQGSASADNNESSFLEWNLLGHLVVAPNPFDPNYPNTEFRVVLLMGVGGPATLGLAHLLTGRSAEASFRPWSKDKIREFIETSEDFLEEVNKLLAFDTAAAEAIISIGVLNDMNSKNHDYEDSRELQALKVEESLKGLRNPKVFKGLLGAGRSRGA